LEECSRGREGGRVRKSGHEDEDEDEDDMATTYRRILSGYDIDFVQDVQDVVERYSIGSCSITSAGDRELEPGLFTSGKSHGPRILPGSLLGADEHQRIYGTCIEGGDAHDNQYCICVYGKDSGLYWTTATGLSERGKRVLEGKGLPTDFRFSDVFGNTILHFLALRGTHRQLVSALEAVSDPTRLNAAHQSFLHLLGPAWFTDDGLNLRHLLGYLHSVAFDQWYARDVYGRTCFHSFRDSMSQVALVNLCDEFGSPTELCRRDAFGRLPWAAEPTSDPLPNVEKKPADVIVENAQMLEFISSCTNEPTKQDSKGRNGLHCAASAILSDITLFKQLETDKGDSKQPQKDGGKRKEGGDSSGERLILRETIVHNLLASNVDVNAYDLEGDTVLMAFVANLPEDEDYKCPVSILQLLIDQGADISARNRRGQTALHVAAQHGRKLALRTLVQNGANANARDHRGKTVPEVLADRLGCSTDDKQIAHYEACYAWMSGQWFPNVGNFSAKPTTVEEWGVNQPPPLALNPSSGISIALDSDAAKPDQLLRGMDWCPGGDFYAVPVGRFLSRPPSPESLLRGSQATKMGADRPRPPLPEAFRIEDSECDSGQSADDEKYCQAVKLTILSFLRLELTLKSTWQVRSFATCKAN